MDAQSKDLFLRASDEIKTLRRENEKLRIRVDTLDDVLCLLHSRPASKSEGMTVDVCWEIDKMLRELPPQVMPGRQDPASDSGRASSVGTG